MINTYGHILNIAQACIPDHSWIPWRFEQRLPNGFWADPSNQTAYFNWLYKDHLRLKHLSEFYSVNLENVVRETGAVSLVQHCHPWPVAALRATFPNHNWLPWRFKKIPNGYWGDEGNVREFLQWLADAQGFPPLKHGHPAPLQWYSLTCNQLAQEGAASLVIASSYSVADIVCGAFPKVIWERWRFERQAKATLFANESPSHAENR